LVYCSAVEPSHVVKTELSWWAGMVKCLRCFMAWVWSVNCNHLTSVRRRGIVETAILMYVGVSKSS